MDKSEQTKLIHSQLNEIELQQKLIELLSEEPSVLTTSERNSLASNQLPLTNELKEVLLNAAHVYITKKINEILQLLTLQH